jgi:hypothetical protein
VAFKKKYLHIPLVVLIFAVYAFIAGSPVPEEEVFLKGWIRSYESVYPEENGGADVFPFEISRQGAIRFGYFDRNGAFTVNRTTEKNLTVSENLFAEYDAVPKQLDIKNTADETVLTITGRNGYPLFLNDRVYLVHFEQNALSEVAENGEIAWTYEFASPLTCVDGAGGMLLLGTLDGTVELLNEKGSRVFFFETSGSRIACIYGVAISRNLSHIAVVSGIDDQRVLLFEQARNTYRVSYHDFIGDGKRSPVHIGFIDDDARLAFETDAGVGLYEIRTRRSYRIPLDGKIAAIDKDGRNGLFFLVTGETETRRQLIGIRYPATVIMRVPFESHDVFMRRAGNELFVGSDRSLASFVMARK